MKFGNISKFLQVAYDSPESITIQHFIKSTVTAPVLTKIVNEEPLISIKSL